MAKRQFSREAVERAHAAIAQFPTHSIQRPNYPVIVTGPGRCGTSSITHMLHEELGVRMYTKCAATCAQTTYGKRGHGEAQWQLVLANQARYGIVNNDQIVAIMLDVGDMMKGKKWGFKHPTWALGAPVIERCFPQMSWVVCTREREATIKSLMRIPRMEKQGQTYTRDEAARHYAQHMNACYKYLKDNPNALWIDLQELIDNPKNVKKRLRDHLRRKNQFLHRKPSQLGSVDPADVMEAMEQKWEKSEGGVLKPTSVVPA